VVENLVSVTGPAQRALALRRQLWWHRDLCRLVVLGVLRAGAVASLASAQQLGGRYALVDTSLDCIDLLFVAIVARADVTDVVTLALE
jgi:hypothetical protein